MTEQEIDALALEAERADAEQADVPALAGGYDPREGYELGDPKRDGPGGEW